MKKNNINVILIILLTFLFSCKFSAEKKIVGTWKLEEIETNQEIKPNELDNFNKAKQEIKSSTMLIFKDDHSYKAIIWGDTINGFWDIDKDKMQLKISNALNGDTTETLIKEISSKKIILTEQNEGVTSTLIFIKI